MTKEEFIKIRDNNTSDVIPLLHFYHNLNLKVGQVHLTRGEFLKLYTQWLQIPMILMAQGVIIYKVINQLEKHFEV